MSFRHTEYLFALLFIPLLLIAFAWALQWKKSAIKRIGNPRLVNELIKNYSPLNYRLKFILLVLGIAAIITGAANLQQPGAMDSVKRKGVDVAIVMDVSKSMLAEDIKPNRLERARQLIYKLFDKLENDRVALILFAGRAYLQMPLTTDHAAARMYVQNAGPDVVPAQGTVISDALRTAAGAFNSKERKFKSILLITDGEDHDPETPKMIKDLADNGIMVNTVGIGSPQGAQIPEKLTNDVKRDEHGQPIISKLNEAELQQLAGGTRGIYLLLNDPDAVASAIMKQLGTIESTVTEDNTFKTFRSYYQWFLAAALVLLVTEFFFPERKWATS